MNSPGHWDSNKYDDAHLSSNDLMKRIPTTPMDATDDFYDRRGNIVQSNCSEQQLKTITWADQICPSNNKSLYSIPTLQCPQSNDDDSSGDEYSYRTYGNASMSILHSWPDDGSSSDGDSSVNSFQTNTIDNYDRQSLPQILILNMETVTSLANDDSNVEEVYNNFDNDISNTGTNVQGF